MNGRELEEYMNAYLEERGLTEDFENYRMHLQRNSSNSQPNEGDRVVAENEPQKKICPDCCGLGYYKSRLDMDYCRTCEGHGQID